MGIPVLSRGCLSHARRMKKVGQRTRTAPSRVDVDRKEQPRRTCASASAEGERVPSAQHLTRLLPRHVVSALVMFPFRRPAPARSRAWRSAHALRSHVRPSWSAPIHVHARLFSVAPMAEHSALRFALSPPTPAPLGEGRHVRTAAALVIGCAEYTCVVDARLTRGQRRGPERKDEGQQLGVPRALLLPARHRAVRLLCYGGCIHTAKLERRKRVEVIPDDEADMSATPTPHTPYRALTARSASKRAAASPPSTTLS
jgi:hypothetical protein